MTKDQIVKMRTIFANMGLAYEIVLDNEHKYTSQDHLLWRDSEEQLTCLRVNPDFNAPNPVEVYVTAYEHIQGIVSAVKKEDLEKILPTMGLPISDIKAIIKDLENKLIFNNTSEMRRGTSYLGINERTR